jgi:opacity protein-like surface antigen
MRTTLCNFTLFLLSGLAASPAFAQATPAPSNSGQPRWEVNASAGLFQGRPSDETRGWDDWYSEGRYAASIGRYWTTHFKTELEFSTTGEGRRYVQEFIRVPGLPVDYPISTEVFHRLQQGSARAVWQFNDNAWVHPYLNAGIVYDVHRSRAWAPDQFYYPAGDPRVVPRQLVRPALNGEKETDRRVGITIGGGSKFYVSQSAYINLGMQITRAKPMTTVGMLAGIGIDF